MNKRPTIKDVAKYAKVSSATVSYVLNDVKKVSDKTRKRVLEAIEELNYYPDFTAVSLSIKKSNLIGIVLGGVDNSTASFLKNNLYYSEFVSGVELVARSHKFDTMITGEGKLEGYSQWVKKRNLDGLIFLGFLPEKIHNEVKELDIPTVLIDMYGDYTNLFNNVKIDDELGGYLATKHLIELGHRDIAFVATNLKKSPVDTKRLKGYKKALAEEGIPFQDNLIIETQDITLENGLIAGKEILDYSQRITGIVTVSDVLAIGIIKALQSGGKDIPNDYSVVGFDDLSISEYITPSLTTIRQDIFEKGRSAASLIINSIESNGDRNKSVELPVRLVVRNSTKRLSE